MGKLILILGENNSGKSRFAEKLFENTTAEKYYIATMISCTKENNIRIEKHKRQREQYNFHTLELPFKVNSAAVSSESVVLLEDVSNLLANNIFENKGTAEEVFDDISSLVKSCQTTVAVSISGLSPIGFDKDTANYINKLNEMNERLFRLSDVVVIMKNNSPVFKKGKESDVLL